MQEGDLLDIPSQSIKEVLLNMFSQERRGTRFFGMAFAASNLAHTKTSFPPPFIMDGRHPERPPRRAAQPVSSADSGERSVAARRSWAAPGLSSGRFVVAAAAIYSV